MSEASEKARSDAKKKVERLTGSKSGAVDASGWTEAPCGFLNTDTKLGNRPISKQNLATGGVASHKHAGRKSRMLGGPTPVPANTAGVAAPPQSRFQFSSNPSPILGAAGLKKGGKARKDGGPVGMDPEISGTRPTGGRIARASGGSTKGKTNINIIIAQKPDKDPMTPPPGAPTPPPMKPPMPVPGPGAMPPGGAPAGPMPGGPNMPPPSMARARGGRTDMKYGAGSGEGRLEKIGKCD